MHRPFAVHRFAVPLLVAALLAPAGCGSGGSGGELPELTAGQAFGEEPTIKISGDAPEEIRFEVLTEGDGPVVESGDLLVADLKGQAWDAEDGEAFDSTYAGRPLVKPIGKGEITPGWDEKIPGVKVGSRVLLVEPTKAEGDMEGQTLVFVIDILGALDGKLPTDGKDVASDDAELPKVTGDEDPEVEIPDGDPPKELVEQVLREGTGEDVEEKQFAVVHYTGLLWRNGETFDSSWKKRAGGSVEPLGFEVGTEGIIKAWNEGLAGKPVGSRVLLVVPPDKGYGPDGNEQAGIKGTDTLVFVVDILGAF